MPSIEKNICMQKKGYIYVPPEERANREQGKFLSGISVLLKNNNSLYSAKSTILNLFMEGFSSLFKATYQKPTHNGNILPHRASKKRTCTQLSQMKSFYCRLSYALWESLT